MNESAATISNPDAATAAARAQTRLRRLLRPSIVVGALSLCAVIGVYWTMALRPGTKPSDGQPAVVGTPATSMLSLTP